jgi:hypothetical protein
MAKESAPDPAIGIWKLCVPLSSFTLGPALKDSVIRVEAWNDGLKVGAEIIDADGNKTHPQIAYKCDGNDYPITGFPLADSISTTRINEHKSESVLKKDGRVILTAKAVIYWNGKTLTVIRRGTDAEGRLADELLTYERQ